MRVCVVLSKNWGESCLARCARGSGDLGIKITGRGFYGLGLKTMGDEGFLGLDHKTRGGEADAPNEIRLDLAQHHHEACVKAK